MTHPERTFIVIPTIGKFIVHIRKYMDPRTQLIDYYMVLVGNDPRKACVNIRVPVDSQQPMKLAYVTSEVACTLDNITPMKGLATIQMIQLATTIAHELSPDTETMVLEDCSHFTCSSPEGDKKMALPSFYIAFHGKTWYEDKFGAYLKNPKTRTDYAQGIAAIDNPSAKPPTFDFTNMDIAEELYPLYDTCSTWGEFFRKISKKYGAKKCMVVQSWIEDAMRHIFGGELVYEMKEWVIPLKAMPKLSYYEIKDSFPTLGGGWNNPSMERVMHRAAQYPFFMMSYKRFMAPRKRTRRSNRH